MKILDQNIEKSVMTVTILIEESEFVLALEKAYQDHKERYRLPEYRDGMAPREKLEQVYGPTVLYDEALDRTIPILYGKFVESNNIIQMDEPEIIEVTWPESGGAAFTVKVPLYPDVRLGQYKGLMVEEQSDKEEYIDAVLNEAAGRMDTEFPDVLIERKLDAMLSREKIRINQDAIYHVLADTIDLLRKTYGLTGITRPMSQIRHEAMDVMLQSISADQGEPSKDRLCFLLMESARQYRDLPDDFREKLDHVIHEMELEKKEVLPEKRIDDVFDAYLGSLGMTIEEWREESRREAALLTRRDILLDAVAETEQIKVTQQEIEEAYVRIADQYGMDAAEIKDTILPETLDWQLRRDKAQTLIVDSAVKQL